MKNKNQQQNNSKNCFRNANAENNAQNYSSNVNSEGNSQSVSHNAYNSTNAKILLIAQELKIKE